MKDLAHPTLSTTSTSHSTHAQPGNTASTCPYVPAEVHSEITALKALVSSLQESLDRERHQSALYQEMVDAQNATIEDLRHHLDIYRLDPSQSSQRLLDDSDIDSQGLPSTQWLIAYMEEQKRSEAEGRSV